MNLQDAFYKVVHSAPGGCEALAIRMGMSSAILRNKANPNTAHNKPNMDDIEKITALTGDLSILEAWAASLNRVLVEMPAAAPLDQIGMTAMVTSVGSTNGAVFQELMAALADGKITSDEYERVAEAIKNAEMALETVKAQFRAMVAQRPLYGAA